MFLGTWSLCFLLSTVALVQSQQTFTPPSVPLAVRSPYLSAWLTTTNGSAPLSAAWPSFWVNSGDTILGWAGFIRIDNDTYTWLGDAQMAPSGNITNVLVTPTRTIFSMQIGPMDVNVTFLSPIEPLDWVKQSIPFSYFALEATSRDGSAHDVKVYADISGEWLSGNRTQSMTFSTTTADSSVYHALQLQDPSPFTEIAQQAEDGTAYIAMSSSFNPTWQLDRDQTCRGDFLSAGSLPDEELTPNVHGISTPWFPVAALSADLGSISSTASPVYWVVGFNRDPSIAYTNATGGTQDRSPYYRTQYDTVQSALEAFLSDFPDALERSTAFDQAIMGNASAVSAEYANIVSLAARQTFGGIDITVGNGTDGKFNESDVMIFMKEIGTTGTTGRVTPVEVLYAASPMFLYVNASYMKALLEPLFVFQSTSQYTLPYAARDLGTEYPVASGDTQSHGQGVEQSANMLIMALAHARFTGDGSLLSRYYGTLKGWADYLVNNTLTPTNQVSADNQQIANLTNLAIKGIIGIQAMSEISQVLEQTADADSFASSAAADLSAWEALALAPDKSHLLSVYGQSTSWALMYNLYADLLLETNLVSQDIYQEQAAFYQTLTTNTYGLPYDSESLTTGSSAWLAFTAATCSNATDRNNLISMVYKHASNNLSSGIFPTTYLTDTGLPSGGIASPGQGAMFANLALNLKNTSIVVPPTTAAVAAKKSSDVGAIAGGVVGGVLGLAVITAAAFFYWRRSHRLKLDQPSREFMLHTPVRDQSYEVTPFPPVTILPDIAGEDQRTATVASSKSQEALQDSLRTRAVSSTGGSSNTPPSSQQPPSSDYSTGSRQSQTPFTPSDVVELRTEVAQLRRVMQVFQEERMEPPPTYVEE